MMLSEQQIATSVGDVTLFRIKNSNQFEVVLCSYGASIYEVNQIHEDGSFDILTLTPESFEDFLQSSAYYGKTIGPTSGRLFGPEVTLFGQTYPIRPYKHPHAQLHGGPLGYSFKHFDIVEIKTELKEVMVSMKATHQHLESDLPGPLDLIVTYRITEDNQIIITYDATAEQSTLCNITNHLYFSLNFKEQTIHHQLLYLSSDAYLDLNPDYTFNCIETSKDTVYDFRKIKPVSHLLNALSQTTFQGIDHPFLVHHEANYVAHLYDPVSHYGLKVYTTYPTIVIYTHNFPPNIQMKKHDRCVKHKGITFECQFEPDGIHHEGLNSAILLKNQTYHHQIIYEFYRKSR